MKGLTGYLKKTLLICSILLCFFSLPENTLAQEFTVYADYHHTWDGNSTDSVIYLTMTTQNSPVVVTYYTITIPDENITPEILSINRNSSLIPTVHRRNGATDLVIDLEKTPIYPDKPITLKITFSTDMTADQLSLISSVKDTVSRDFSFTYPASIGEISWSSAPITKVNSKGNKIEIITASPNTDTVTISLGKNISYTYTINKTLLNLSEEMILSEITLPLNNNNQHISVNSVSSLPDKAYKDIDNNNILQYHIAPQSSIDVSIEGNIIMNKTPYPLKQQYSIEEEKLWKITNQSLPRHLNRKLKDSGLNVSEEFSDIYDLETKEEKELLYESIYHYVIDNLEPDKLTVGSLTGSQRLGGQETLLKQSISTSEDFADALISLYRYYGIPARFVIGYVTDISNYHSEGMYHYWVEYFDEENNDWVIVDPYLEDLSNTSLWQRDMKDHVSLIYRYSNANTPKLPFYSQQDFEISISEIEPNIINNFEPSLVFQPYNISDPYLIGSLTIQNTGTTILDSFNIEKSNPNLPMYIDYIENNSREIILPGQTYSIRINIPTKDVKETIYAVINTLSGTQQTEDKHIEVKIETVKEYKYLDIFAKLLSLLLYIILGGTIYIILNRIQKNA